MAIPSVMQGLIETEDGKVFELDSPKGETWLEAIGSFRYEPSGGGKAYTVRREPSGYWYGCRKVAGKVRKKYIGKDSEVNIAKLEEVAEALEVPPVPRVKKVAEVAEKVAEVAQDRLTALELEVANLRKTFEAIQGELRGKSESGNFQELPTVTDSELQNELSNLKAENEALKQQLESTNLPSGHLYQEIENLKERNRLLTIKSREERQKLEDELKSLEYSFESAGRRLAEKQARLDEVEEALEALQTNQPSVEFELPEAFDVLNKLKGNPKYKDTKIGVVEAILRIIEKS